MEHTLEHFLAVLSSATKRTLKLAKEYVVDDLPEEVRYTAYLRADTHAPASELEDYWARSDQGILRNLTRSQLASELYISGRCPEWVNLSVAGADGKYTYVEASFSRTFLRFSPGRIAEDSIAPFQVRGPTLPPGYDFDPHAREPVRFRLGDASPPWYDK